MIYLTVIEKDPLFQKIFKDFFQGIGGYNIVEVYGQPGDLLHSPRKAKHLDIILYSLNNGDEDPGQIKLLKKVYTNTRVIVSVTSPESPVIINCLKNYADGILLKSEGLYSFHSAITSCLGKGLALSPIITRNLVEDIFFQKAPHNFDFTRREMEIIRLLNEGLSYMQMANRSGITSFTINHHLKKIYKKAGVNSRSQLVALMKQQGIT